ncbi:MAG: hypothetical protein HQ477_12810 [Chloroflexi bacterium]|nr:hypothetical protein [Chloroflexota bacterium]
MTTRSNYKRGQTFDNNEDVVGEQLELSAGKQVLAALNLTVLHLRRTVVFIPIFGMVFLAIGFLWLQSVREEASLNMKADQLTILLDQPAPQPENLLTQAGGWDTAYHVVLEGRVSRPNDSDLVERVIDAAVDSGLIVLETGTTKDDVETIENEDYTATPVLIRAIGMLDSIESYLAMLETADFSSFGIEASTVEEGVVGYQLTLRGLYYSLPESFGEIDPSENVMLAATPIVPIVKGSAK